MYRGSNTDCVNRREVLATLGTTVLPLSAGCSAVGNETTGHTYALECSEPIEEPTGQVLNYDTAGLMRSQERIVEEAIRTDSYSEAHVSWNSLPGHEGITMEFRMVIQLIARHVDRDPEVVSETTFETPSQYDGTTYRSVVTVERPA